MMIDSEKLMGRMESKGTLLSEKSISNMGVIRRRLVDIDGMLKDKLVLAKVREGIRRQEEERLRRVEREDDIEDRDDDDRDIDMDGGKIKRKKPKPGGPSNILGPAGAILTGAGIALIANNLGTFRVTAQVLKGIGSVAVSTFMGAATAINAGYNIVNAIEAKTLQMFGNKGLQTLKQFQKVFSTFVNVAIVTAVTAGGVSVLGKTRRSLFPGRFKRPKFDSNEIAGITDLRTKPTKRTIGNLEKILKKRVGRPKKFQTLAEVEADINLREFQKLQKKFFKLKKSKKVVVSSPFERITKSKSFQKRAKRLRQNIKKGDAVEAANEFAEKTGQVRLLRNQVKLEGDDAFYVTKKGKIKLDIVTFGDIDGTFKDFYFFDARLSSYIQNKRVQKATIEKILFDEKIELDDATGQFKLDDSNFKPDDFNTQDQKTQQPQSNVKRKIKSDSNFFEDPSGGPGAMKLRRGIISNADNVTNVKSLSKLLEAFGGLPLVKATRQFLGNTVGRIPLFGDIIGVLLDYFVFKQPLQKALFMAAGGALGGSIGAWLGGILGTVVPVVGNLAGAVVGGFLGGAGGDLLGGFLYDVLFAGKPGFPAATTQNPLEKTAKSTLKLGLSGGGLVPALLSMNNGGSVPDIGYSASYDKPGAGSVRFIPIPITSSSDTGSTNTSSGGVFITKRKRSQSSLYAGGLIT